jgi:superfamily II DNA or RNA helicase
MKNKTDIQKQALNAIGDTKRCSVNASMGSGKTLIGLKHMDSLYNKYSRFLIVGPKKAILNEWESQAEEHNLLHLIDHMVFTTYLSLNKQDHDFDWVYLDECHSLLNSHDIWLNKYSKGILGLTGTPPKFKSSEKGAMVNKYCPVIYDYTTDEAIEDNILNNYKIVVHMVDLDEVKNIKVTTKDKEWFTSEKLSYDYWTKRISQTVKEKELMMMRIMRMKEMMKFNSKEQYARKLFNSINDKCIIFANTQDQAERLYSHTYHSNNAKSENNLEQFKSGKLKKLACVLQLSEGVNIPNLKQGIIMHAYGNERKSAQRIGRMLRLNPKETATIHVLCYANTVDERWVNSALEDFDQSKINFIY